MIIPALRVEIRDARSGRWLADSAMVLARESGRVDTLRAGAMELDGRLRDRVGADERTGTYVVEVRRPGYKAWQAGGVAVERGPCHVKTVLLRADLEPEH